MANTMKICPHGNAPPSPLKSPPVTSRVGVNKLFIS